MPDNGQRTREWRDNVYEVRPEGLTPIVVRGDAAHAMSVYMAVFAREPWNYNVGFAAPTKEDPAQNIPLPLFWECPLLPKYLNEGKIFEGRQYDEEGSARTDLFIRVEDFVEYLSALADYLESPFDRVRTESDFEKMARYWAQGKDAVRQALEENTWPASGYVRLVNSYPISGISELYGEEKLKDPNYYLVGAVDGKFIRLTETDQLAEGEVLTTVLRVKRYAGNPVENLLGECKEEGLPLTTELSAMITRFWHENVELGDEMNDLVIFGDIASLVEGQSEGIKLYAVLAETLNKDAPANTYAYFTRKGAKTYNPRASQRFMNHMLQPPNSFTQEAKMLDWVGKDGVDYRLVVFKRDGT